MKNNVALLRRVQLLLESHGVKTWVFGGWAEELRGLIPQRPHHDIDLLYPATDFERVDEFIATGLVDEIQAKHFHHKRAFEVDSIMVELILVRDGGVTDFWGHHTYPWPADLLDDHGGVLRLASASSLIQYRSIRPPPRPN